MGISIGSSDSYINAMSSQVSNSANSAAGSKISSSANGLSASSTKEEITEAVKSFEQYFVEQMLKEFKDSAKLFSSDSSKDDGMTDYYMNFAIEEVAKQMVEDYGGKVTDDFVAQVQRNYGIEDV